MSDRQLFFALTPREQICYERLRTLRTKLHCLRHLGYFKARQRCYVINIDVMNEDIEYLSKRYLDGARIPDLNVSTHTRRVLPDTWCVLAHQVPYEYQRMVSELHRIYFSTAWQLAYWP